MRRLPAWRPRSLHARILWRVGAVGVLVIAVGAGLQYYGLRAFLVKERAGSLARSAHLQLQAESAGAPLTAAQLTRFLAGPDVVAQVWTASGALLASAAPPPLMARRETAFVAVGTASAGADARGKRAKEQHWVVPVGSGWLVVAVPLPPNAVAGGAEAPAFVVLATPMRSIAGVLQDELLLLLALGLLSLGLGLWLLRPTLRQLLQPLVDVTTASARMAEGDYSQRVAVPQTGDEVTRLATHFNAMAEAVEHAFTEEQQAKERLRRFVADASHELRTPLTAIRGYLDLWEMPAEGHPPLPERTRYALRREVERMIRLVNDLLAAARLDHQPVLERTAVNLSALLQDLLPVWKTLAPIPVTVDGTASPRWIWANADASARALTNVVRNAQQHAPDGSLVQIEVSASPEAVYCTVRDQGPGIAPEHLPHVFDRFYRVDASRAANQGGSGLGLAIARESMRAQGGDLTVTSTLGQGSTFTFRWCPGPATRGGEGQ